MFKLISRYHKPNFNSPKFLIPKSYLLHNPTKTLTLIPNYDQTAPISEQFDQRVSHPWPEWVELMKQLSEFGYFQGTGNDKNPNRVRTACLDFARDRVDLFGYFSRENIKAIVGFGCPVVDRKVINSGKRLRAYFGIDEANVCSSCLLRGNCERAYAKARESDGGHTIDLMRLLLTYGLDYFTYKLENKFCFNERVTESVRNLLKEIVEYSKKLKPNPQTPGITKSNSPIKRVAHQREGNNNDWSCSRCEYVNLAGNIDCVQCATRKSGKNHNHLALKKGDWLCEKCKFLNFAKNTRCLECNENPPKRKLYGGEWECDSCNYINFRRNMACIRCDHRRPRASIL